MAKNNDITFEIKEHIGILSKNDNNWTKEVNIVVWNGGVPKIDIREWDPEHKRITRGLTLVETEAEALAAMLAARYGNSR